MSWILIGAIIAAGAIATFTDWLFMGVLFHERYNTYPEVWWPQFREQGDKRAIIYSSALAFVTTAAVVALCVFADVDSVASGIELAVIAWIAGPLVLTVTNGLWIKIDPAVTFAHALGYLARFLIAGIAAGIALPHL